MWRPEQTSDLRLEVKTLTFTEEGIAQVGRNPQSSRPTHKRPPLQVVGNNSPSFGVWGLSLHLGAEVRGQGFLRGVAPFLVWNHI